MYHIIAKITTMIIELDHYIYGVAIPSHPTFVCLEIFKVDKLKKGSENSVKGHSYNT